MTKKNVMKAIADANGKNKKRTIIAGASAGAAGIITSAIVFAIGHHENNELEDEIEKLDNKITSVVTTIAIATTKPTEKDVDAKRNKFLIVNMFVMADAIDRKVDLYTKKSDATIDSTTKAVTKEAEYEKMNNPKLSDFKEEVIYMKEEDYAKMYNTAETTEDKADKK